ncbi:hypothetical protein TWF281_007249 [Arthrobotrys megalospora]
MVLDNRPQEARKPSGSRFSHGFFTPEEKHSKTDYIGAFADGLIGRRDRRVTKDDMCIDLSRSPFATSRMVTEDNLSSSSRSSSRTGASERTSHTSFEQELSGEPYSPAIAGHHGRTVPYPTPQPASKPQTPVRNLKMQRFPSLSGVDLSNLPPTPDSLRATPLFGSGLDNRQRKKQPSPEIPSAGDAEFEEIMDKNVDLTGDDEDELEGDEWEDVEEGEEGDTDDEDSERYETATDADEDEMESSGFVSEEEAEEEDELLHFGEDSSPYDKNSDEGLDEDGAYTPKLRAKLEASPQISPLLGSATVSSPSPSPSPTIIPLPIANSPASLAPSTEVPLLVNRTFKLTSHTFSRPSSSSVPHPSSLFAGRLSSSSSTSIDHPPSFAEDHSSASVTSYPSDLPSSDFPHDTLTASPASPASPSLVVNLLSDFIGTPSASSSLLPVSTSNPLDLTGTHLSGLPINRSSNYLTEHCSGPSINLSSYSPPDIPSIPSLNTPSTSASPEYLDGMPPFIRIHKTADGLAASSSMERQLPQRSARPKPKIAGSNIPENATEFRAYAQECIWGADAGRLSPWNLHEGEYKVLRNHLNQLHVTTYLNIRNGILRLWLKNSKERVTREQAMGCCKEERFFGLAEVALDWLTRSGYINHGCLEIPTNSSIKKPGARRRKTIAVIGAGISGLATARQLEALLASSGECLGGSGAPDVVVFEGRHRLGGRVYSATLAPGPHNLPDGLEPAIDIGGQIVMGYDARNPLAALIVDQLGIPFHTIGKVFPIHDYDGKVIGDGRDNIIEQVHNDILARVAAFSCKEPPPMTAHGDVDYILKGKDPWGVGGLPLAVAQGGGHIAPPIPSFLVVEREEEAEEIVEWQKTLRALEIKVTKGHNEDGQACLGRTMEGVLPGYADLLKTDARDLRLYNWFQANLEYGNAVEVNGSSLEHWDQDDGNEPAGAHTMIMGGYSQLAKGLSCTPSPLDIRIGHIVTRIKYDPNNKKKGVTLKFADNSEFTADKVIVTLPLGVLKQEKGVEFDPPLPGAKRDAIHRLGFGLLNKVIMVYEKAFWDIENAGFGCLRGPEEGKDENLLSSYEKKRGRFYIWWNTTDAVGRPTLVGLMVGDAAEQVENESTEVVVKEATSILKRCWGEDKVPDRPKECVVTRWRKDPFAFGSYSYVAPGSTGADYDTIAEPINDQIFFAGEHTSRKYPATVHGAYISGLRVAGEVAESVLGPIQVPSPLIGPRVMKSKTETDMRTIAKTTVTSTKRTKSTSTRTVNTAKIQVAKYDSQVSTTTKVVQQKTKRKALDEDEDEYRAPSKKARTQVSRAEPLQQKRKRKAADEPEPEVRPTKKARTPSVQAEPPQNSVPIDRKPEEPKKETANPFLIYQKDFFKTAQNRANQTKREQTGISDAKADRNEVRVVLGDMWRNAAAETKSRYRDQADQNKRNNLAKLNDYKRQVVAWELRQITNVGTTVVPATASTIQTLPSAIYPTPADTTPSVDDRDMALSAL